MEKTKWTVAVVAVFILAFSALADAQPWRGKGTWGTWGTTFYHWNWNPATVETLKGEVTSKDILTPPKGRGRYPTVGMTLKTDQGVVYVHLGPQWSMDKQDLTIEVGDTVEVTGSRITVDGNPVLLASSVKKGEKTWQFRDQQGFPYWSGRRR